ncbi:abortive infection family protein [Pseudoxanthomonas helianthi]|uniref:Abortive infection family protein n=1 Tax=Pseudoxanthomonas helianthi TaxID=1453541 RepID=A0A941ATI1_9GAMM|nr:abortive infection family protein [Pseudoxanthomonas helianthi]MBP3983762.1 abortive infection family protein [Pseudoxanthomonas helianthi]
MGQLVISETVITALSRLVDDGQAEVKREPTHSAIEFQIDKARLSAGDPSKTGQVVGKAKRVRGVLSWGMENAPLNASQFAEALLAVVRGSGGFRETSPNYAGREAIIDAIAAFRSEGYELSTDGELRPLLLDSLSGKPLTEALNAYVRRARAGALDAALVTGTGKDLLEATAKHVLMTKFGTEPTITNFPTLLAQAFIALGLCIEKSAARSPQERVDAALYELACGVNALRNAQGIGHGRPFPSTVSPDEARIAVESMGAVADRLLTQL